MSHQKYSLGNVLSKLACLIAIFTSGFCLSGCDLDFLKNAEEIKTQAKQALDAKNYSEAASRAQKLTEVSPANYEGYFLLAQAKAQVGDKNAALIALEGAIKAGLKDDAQIDENVNLEPIKSMTAYVDLMSTSFPSRIAVVTSTGSTARVVAGQGKSGVSLQEVNGMQVVRAGDITIEIPTK